MYKIKRWISAFLAVTLGLLCVFCIKVAHTSRFADIEGGRTYFLDSASSQGLQKNNVSLMDVMRIKGECVQTDISTYTGGRYVSKEEIAQEIAKKYRAEILFCEEVCGTVSYYAYTAAWADSVSLYGKKINLHIAIDEERLTVGSPMIFGGY